MTSKAILKTLCATAAITAILGLPLAETRANDIQSPDILVLGDSQLVFGSGPAFLDFFQDLKTHCGSDEEKSKSLKKLGGMSVGILGARSTSLNSWSGRTDEMKWDVCEPDPNWPVNATLHGVIKKTDEEYLQIGKSSELPFCQPDLSPLEAMFADGRYNPKLFVMYFLGKSTDRWINDAEGTFQDVEATVSQIPEGMGCIFMTTAPSYRQEIIDYRLLAQEKLKETFGKAGSRCTFIEGLNPDTIEVNRGNKDFFALKDNGEVQDPYHPNGKAAARFLEVQRERICAAVFEQLDKY